MAARSGNSQAITITATFNESQAWLYAQFLKRVTYHDYRSCAMSDEEAYVMLAAGELIRDALREKGFAPR
jgi:hypothetical protein